MNGYVLSYATPAAYGWGHGSGWGWHMMPFFGGWGMLIWVVLLLALLFWVMRRGGAPGCDQARETPLDILKRRYASGEITRDQFQAMKADL